MQSQGRTRSNDRESRSIGLTGITLHDLTRILRAQGRSPVITARSHTYEDEDEDDDDNDYLDEYSESHRQTGPKWFPEVVEPQTAGVELLKSGDFGRVADKLRSRRSDVNVAKLLISRSMRPKSVLCKEDYASVRALEVVCSLANSTNTSSRISYLTLMGPRLLLTMLTSTLGNIRQV